jgi:hypothetical protein
VNYSLPIMLPVVMVLTEAEEQPRATLAAFPLPIFAGPLYFVHFIVHGRLLSGVINIVIFR